MKQLCNRASAWFHSHCHLFPVSYIPNILDTIHIHIQQMLGAPWQCDCPDQIRGGHMFKPKT